ncbi:M15 family metallopeptidase [Alteromonas lipolytica]|uniref:D-alanyl-D-alanine carboxypeptidase n=1 Tax=Alteromonas lipolytica TaxID=1856405 RepID=A0A1E8FK60_9ALTE|nr:M15 family metallopeptidase [Alteromonas lipolytica]OFI36327.1 D-alanyl-D-alanine carboxypeptidase [Alteromonas lipolytica]GGF70805.1 D-alanyl-D-alanine carboxypeptidase [Alteromonas lipolytica]
MNLAQAWLGRDDSALIAVGESHRLLPDVAAAFSAMQTQAQADGQDLQLVSSYRSFERQLAIWNRKWRGELPLYNHRGERVDSARLTAEERVYTILIWSALPGGSRHHWGSDLDVYDKASVDAAGGEFDLVDAEYRPGGPCYALAQWLNKHLDSFGFSRPFLQDKGGVATELWHLSHTVSAAEFEKFRSQQALSDCLNASQMEGKQTVLAMLDELYPRFVLNLGAQET